MVRLLFRVRGRVGRLCYCRALEGKALATYSLPKSGSRTYRFKRATLTYSNNKISTVRWFARIKFGFIGGSVLALDWLSHSPDECGPVSQGPAYAQVSQSPEGGR